MCIPSALRCRAEEAAGVWVFRREYRGRSQGEAALLYFTRWERQDWSTELAGRGAPGHLLLLRGRSNSYPSPVLFLKEGDARAALPCARAFHAPATHSPFRPDPNQPLPSRADLNFTQEAAETKSYHIHRHHRLSVSQPCSDPLLPSPQGHWCGETEQEMSKPPPLLPAAMHPSSSHLGGGWALTSLRANGSSLPWELRG